MPASNSGVARRRGAIGVVLLIAAFTLVACSQGSYTLFVNSTGEPLVITYASPNEEEGDNRANGSPWFWPIRTDPVLEAGSAHKLTTYCYGCNSRWLVRVRSGRCELSFDIPAAPDDALDRADWQIFVAYRDATVLLNRDHLLYRVPAYAGGYVDVERIPQPEGYPLKPVSQTECGTPRQSP